jgi:hypothetical protein
MATAAVNGTSSDAITCFDGTANKATRPGASSGVFRFVSARLTSPPQAYRSSIVDSLGFKLRLSSYRQLRCHERPGVERRWPSRTQPPGQLALHSAPRWTFHRWPNQARVALESGAPRTFPLKLPLRPSLPEAPDANFGK